MRKANVNRLNIDHLKIESFLQEASNSLIVPFLNKLQKQDINLKSKDEIVTSVDRAVESFLSERLTTLIPGSKVSFWSFWH